MKHELKTWPKHFQASWAQRKTFEIRINDRAFKVNDEVVLQEWEPRTKEYTGREIQGFITHVSTFSQKKGYCVFQIDIRLYSE